VGSGPAPDAEGTARNANEKWPLMCLGTRGRGRSAVADQREDRDNWRAESTDLQHVMQADRLAKEGRSHCGPVRARLRSGPGFVVLVEESVMEGSGARG